MHTAPFSLPFTMLPCSAVKQVAAGYAGGDKDIDDLENDGSRYVTMSKSKNGSDTVPLGNITGTITCDPWYPNNIQTATGIPLRFDGVNGVKYKIAGFKVSWIDKTPVGRQDVTLSVKSAVIICQHDTP